MRSTGGKKAEVQVIDRGFLHRIVHIVQLHMQEIIHYSITFTFHIHFFSYTSDISYAIAYFKESNDSSPFVLFHPVNQSDKCFAQDRAMVRWYSVPLTNEATGDVASLRQ